LGDPNDNFFHLNSFIVNALLIVAIMITLFIFIMIKIKHN